MTEVRSRELGVSVVAGTLSGRASQRRILKVSERTRDAHFTAQIRFASLGECPGAATASEAVALGRG